MEGEEYSASPQSTEATEVESVPSPERVPNLRKKKNKSKRRFSDEQIRSMESMFKSETKLEPRKKLQLAGELGLQPRQVAIWFQNRRARWKSKQIEQDYRILKANYDNLHSRFESLKKEKQSLLMQLQKLTDQLEKPHDWSSSSRSKDLKSNSASGGSDSDDTRHEFDKKASCLNKGVVMYTDDDEGGHGGYFQQDEAKLPNMGEQTIGPLTLADKWCSFDPTGPFDLTCGSSSWWNYWAT